MKWSDEVWPPVAHAGAGVRVDPECPVHLQGSPLSQSADKKDQAAVRPRRVIQTFDKKVDTYASKPRRFALRLTCAGHFRRSERDGVLTL